MAKTWEKNGKQYTDTSGLTSSDVSGLLEIREDNAATIMSAIASALVRGLEKVGLVAEGYAKEACPVDTGRLRNSITHSIDAGEKAVYIGTNVEYGPYVELGTSRQEAKPFLKPAAQDHGSQYRSILEGELGGS